VTGGAPVTLCAITFPSGISWGNDGILFGEPGKGVMRVSASGGTPELLVRLNDRELAHDPRMLPDGETVLFTLAKSAAQGVEDKGQVVVESLKSHRRTTLVSGANSARYLATGHIVYALGGVLFARPFDRARQVITGEPVPVIEGVRRAQTPTSGVSLHFSVSENGSLIFLPGPTTLTSSPQLDLALSDRNGKLDLLKLPPGSYQSPRISPDGKRVAFYSDDSRESALWIYELSGTSAPLRITFGGHNRFPVWSPDGLRVAFQSDLEGARGIFSQRADGVGTPERLTKADQETEEVPESWSPKGDALLFTVTKGSTISLWTLSLPDKKKMPFGGVTSGIVPSATFSPDGRWVAYDAAESLEASTAVYVQPFPATGEKHQISKDDDGHHPLWSPDGMELFYIPGPGQFAAVAISTRPRFSLGRPVPVARGALIFGSRAVERNHDILPDGRFIGVAPASGQAVTTAPQIHVVLNWFEELKQRAPTR
jgi:WD40 repeat protein